MHSTLKKVEKAICRNQGRSAQPRFRSGNCVNDSVDITMRHRVRSGGQIKTDSGLFCDPFGPLRPFRTHLSPAWHGRFIKWCDQRITDHQKLDEQVQRAAELMGVGSITASALVATVGEFRQFRNGAQFAAWLDLTPKQYSSGGKTSLGSITKRGSVYLRTLLIQGAKAIALTRQYDNPIFLWAQKLRERIGWQRAVVALANKNARILWAVMTREKRYDAHHVSCIPLLAAVTAPALVSVA